MSNDPSDLSVDLRIVQLYGEGTVGTTWSRVHPHGHLSLVEWLDTVVDKGPQEVCACQPTMQQLLDDIM
jgi:hypothetical protein